MTTIEAGNYTTTPAKIRSRLVGAHFCLFPLLTSRHAGIGFLLLEQTNRSVRVYPFYAKRTQFTEGQTYATSIGAKSYGILDTWPNEKNEPKTKPNEPNSKPTARTSTNYAKQTQFPKSKMNLTSYKYKDYINMRLTGKGENKPNQTQFAAQIEVLGRQACSGFYFPSQRYRIIMSRYCSIDSSIYGYGGCLMSHNRLFAALIVLVLIGFKPVFAADEPLLEWWSFDDSQADAINGGGEYVDGVVKNALKFDGFTTFLTRTASKAPAFDGSFTIEAWIAPQTYSWNQSAIISQAGDESLLRHSQGDIELVRTEELKEKNMEQQRHDRVFFGIDDTGHIVMRLMINGQLNQCVSDVRVPLLKWSHVVGTFDASRGIDIYVNGKPAASLEAKGVVTPAVGHDLFIGKSQAKMPATNSGGPDAKLQSHMLFDGLMDEVKIHNRALGVEEVEAAYSKVRPTKAQPLDYRVMPSGPVLDNPEFGASYCRLRYAEQWEKHWRVGPDPDILVTFDQTPVRMVFWRGTNYGAAWVAENGKWMGDQSVEATSNSTGWGCSEHMSDKQSRYSHVKLIENNDARIVVHWHYAVSDVVYGISRVGLDGWGEWADEYYYIYPDAVSTRQQILHAKVHKHEWQETIVLHQPGTTPEDNIELDALTWGDMDGNTKTYTWRFGPRDETKLPDMTIQVVNLKSRYKPFIILQPKSRAKLMGTRGKPERSHFPWWNHWPVGQLPNDGRGTSVPDRPAHSSLSQSIEYSSIVKHDPENETYTAVSLCGMSEKTAEKLTSLARSWNRSPKLMLNSDTYISDGYDVYQRAYVLQCNNKGKPSKLEFTLDASADSPVVNPAFVIKNWGDRAVRLKIDGKEIKQGKTLRIGYNHSMQGTDLIIWAERESTKPVRISLWPKQ